MAVYFKVHFIGIGGIGVSALARYYISQGWRVSGSDLVASEITKSLETLGVEVYCGSRSLKNRMPDLVIYSPAVNDDNPELKEGRQLGIKSMSYPQALGELTKKYKTIAVAGAHGKSTTTAMIGLMMVAAKMDPTVIVGTKVREFGDSNFRLGKSQYLVIEACEYDRSFLNYWPEIIVITNVEMDHVECYKSETKLIETFKEFVSHLPASGALVVCGDDANVLNLESRLKAPVPAMEKYSINQPEAVILRKSMKLPGEHNVANGLAAFTVGKLLHISDKIIFSSLEKYKGSWRRFDEAQGIIEGKKIITVSDYGHHPTQIKLTMEAARTKWPRKKIICVFQPHQAYRTFLLFDKFVQAFKSAPLDKIFITDIYQVSGRESATVTKKVSSKKLVAAVKKKTVEYVPQAEVFDRLKQEIEGGEVVLVMGAGNIYDLSKKIVSDVKIKNHK